MKNQVQVPSSAPVQPWTPLQMLFTDDHAHGISMILSVERISDALPRSVGLDVSVFIHTDTKTVLKKLRFVFYVQVIADATAED